MITVDQVREAMAGVMETAPQARCPLFMSMGGGQQAKGR
jgi:hypothetical protein